MQRIQKASTFIVPAMGGEVMAITPEGEIVWSVGLSGGIYPAKTYVQLLTADQILDVSEGVVVTTPQDRLKRIKMANAYESGANPVFEVTSAARMQRELELKLRALDQSSAKLERRMASLDEMEARVSNKAALDAFDPIDGGDTGEDPTIDPQPAPAPSDGGTV